MQLAGADSKKVTGFTFARGIAARRTYHLDSTRSVGSMIRRLSLEALEARRFLNGDPSALEPVDGSVGLVSFDTAQRRIAAADFQLQVEVVEGGVTASSVDEGERRVFLSEDFNGDGVTDFLSTDDADNWRLYVNDGTQLFEIAAGTGPADTVLLGTADFNQDGLLDIASYREASGQLIVSINATDTFTHQVWGEFRSTAAWTNWYVGDFDGDSKPDVLGGQAGGHWWLAKNNEGQNFFNYRWGKFGDYGWENLLSGEFTGDDHQDILARAPDNTWWLWAGSETGFESAVYFGHWKIRTQWSDVSVADFDGDGREDVLGRSDDGNLWVGSSDGNRLNTWSWGSGWIDRADWSQVTVVDMNGDGRPDQVGRAADNTWWYALNTGQNFYNYFWQRREGVELVVPAFKREVAVDVSDYLPQPDEPTPSVVTNPLSASLNADGRYVLTLEEPQLASVIRVYDENEAFIADDSGTVQGFYRGDNNYWLYRFDQPVMLSGTISLGLVRVPGGDLRRAKVELEHENRLGRRAMLSADQQVPVAPAIITPAAVNPSSDYQAYTAGFATVRDGYIALSGSFQQLAGIEVRSSGGFLSLDSFESTIGDIDRTAPFISSAVVPTKGSDLIVIGVVGAQNRVDFDGELLVTSIRYNGDLEHALMDLTVRVGAEDLSIPRLVPFQV